LGVDFIAELGAEVRELRARISVRPADEQAPRWIRRLGYLHVLDARDESGERTESFALLRSLIEALLGAGIPAGVRASSEAALEVAAFAALSRGQYAEATALLDTFASRIEGEVVQRHLGLIRAVLLAREGDREEASALVASIAAASEDPDEVRALSRLATVLMRLPGHRGAHPGFAEGFRESSAVVGTPTLALSVAPNPVRERATVELRLDIESRVYIAVHDVLGREVLVLSDGTWRAGAHILWVDFGSLAPGPYIIRARVEDGRETRVRRVTVVR
jgi:hypothetical protein